MSTPNPGLVAAAPVLATSLRYVKEAITTILTGDPMLLPARIQPAVAILDAKIVLLAPELATVEEAVVLTQTTTGLDGLIAKLDALSAGK